MKPFNVIPPGPLPPPPVKQPAAAAPAPAPAPTPAAPPNSAVEQPKRMDANSYVPKFLPDGTVTLTVMGFSHGIRSMPWCLDMLDLPNLVNVLKSLGYSITSAYLDVPWQNQMGTFNQPVPWLTFASGVSVNAGLVAESFNHGVSPFVGTPFAAALAAIVNPPAV